MVIREQSQQNSAAAGKWSLNEEFGLWHRKRLLGGDTLEPSHGALNLRRSLRPGPQEWGGAGRRNYKISTAETHTITKSVPQFHTHPAGATVNGTIARHHLSFANLIRFCLNVHHIGNHL